MSVFKCCWGNTLVVNLLSIFIIHGWALPFDPFGPIKQNTHSDDLFTLISEIGFDMQDIIAMYRDVAAVERTVGCSGNCRTPIAIWVLQSVSPCSQIKKEDCSKGLVCCLIPKKVENTSATLRTNNTSVFAWDTMNEVDPMTFVQDPIPGDYDYSAENK